MRERANSREVCATESFPGLPTVTRHKTRPLHRPRVCIATYEIAGPCKNGGIGTAYFSLASALAEAGQEVTVLYLGRNYYGEPSDGEWRSYYRNHDIQFVTLPSLPMNLGASDNAKVSYETYQWLRTRDFDVVHFPELPGHGYYSELAKHQGLDFHHTTICVGTHSPSTWVKILNREFLSSPYDLEIDFMERQSVALADVLVSPSRYLITWLQSNGWQLPEKSYVQQYILSPELWAGLGEDKESVVADRPVREIVFFGRLEERKGLRLFCDALDRLTRIAGGDFEVTFLGRVWKIGGMDAVEYIRERAKKWQFQWRAITDFDHGSALHFLLEGGRVAVMPSLEDNLPNTVLECLSAHIPFLASRAGGIPELVADEDLERVTFPLDPDDLAKRLHRALKEGIRGARPAVDPKQNKQAWIDWHIMLAAQRGFRDVVEQTVTVSAKPLVTVCLIHYERPKLLRHAIASLEAQDWPNFEVILVDDGSTKPETLTELEQIERQFNNGGWRVLRQSNRYIGAARNAAAAQARGDYILFMDDDNYAKPDELSTFVRVAQRTGADILTCFLDAFEGEDRPEAGRAVSRYLFLGAAIAPSIFRNHLGDSNFFVRAPVFRALGGFTEDYGTTCEDWEFLSKAVLRGYKLEVVPRALVSYRVQKTSMLSSTLEYDNRMRALRPFLDMVPPPFKDVVSLAMGALHIGFDGTSAHSGNGSNNHTGNLDLNRLPKYLVTSIEQWTNYCEARHNLPPRRLNRISYVMGMLLRGDYHRFSHGFGSALRDLRKPR